MYQRNVVEELIRWKNSKTKKPLVLRGARQVGKSFILKLEHLPIRNVIEL